MAVLSPSALPRPFNAGRPLAPRPAPGPRHSAPGAESETPVAPTAPAAAAALVAQPAVLALVLGLVAAFLVTLAVSVVAGAPQRFTAAASAGPAGPAESAAYPAWTVEPGDTLWSIAQQVAPEADPRAVVLQLQVLNGVGPGHVLQPGEVLQVPAGGR